MEEYRPKIFNTFTNSKGEKFDRVREIRYARGKTFLGTKFVAATKCCDKYRDSFIDDDDGVFIQQVCDNPTIAYRVYNCWNDYGFSSLWEDRLIQSLQERQQNIKLSTFPTGVITLDGNIVGQEIPFYENHITLHDLSKSKLKVENPIRIYREILDIIKEMLDNGILYMDAHGRNFLLNKENILDRVKIIDFESRLVSIDYTSKSELENLFDHYAYMISSANENFEITDRVGKFIRPNDFDEAFSQLAEMEKKLVRK